MAVTDACVYGVRYDNMSRCLMRGGFDEAGYERIPLIWLAPRLYAEDDEEAARRPRWRAQAGVDNSDRPEQPVGIFLDAASSAFKAGERFEHSAVRVLLLSRVPDDQLAAVGGHVRFDGCTVDQQAAGE